ncbi:hypothetical protein [Planomicrobium sp. CPCC 101079]|nr:hypothetical protein [Planomicrobium sp. CPCC 101079]
MKTKLLILFSTILFFSTPTDNLAPIQYAEDELPGIVSIEVY